MIKHETLSAVIFDWAGTIVDFGSCAPMAAFVRLFRDYGVDIDIAEARAPMGMAKWDHIHALGTQERIGRAWLQARGTPFGTADADELYRVFTPMNAASVAEHADFIPGALETVAWLRSRGLRIGSTTGYNRPIMDVLAPIAARGGYVPDNIVCAGDLAQGRPSPLMMYRCFADLGVWPASSVVKVDDTVPGIEEGLNAGTWTVAVSVSGNAMGLTLAEWEALGPTEQMRRRDIATSTLKAAGAHAVIDSVAQMPAVIEAFERRLQSGERPEPGGTIRTL